MKSSILSLEKTEKILLEAVHDQPKFFRDKILLPSMWGSFREEHPEKILVTTNGCYDVLHPGHLHIFFSAQALGDLLVVGVNSDLSVQNNKGPMRPIHPLLHRMQMLAAISCIDYVTWFHETDPCRFLQALKPHVHVVGDEYRHCCKEESLVQQQGGCVEFIKKIPGLSSTNTITTILDRYENDRLS